MPGVSRPLLLGHRGARQYAPENTFAAFDRTLKHGCDGFEFDVRLTKDGAAIVFHDAHIDVTPVAEMTFADITKLIPDLPRLSQVVERYASSAFLNIELKVTGTEDQTLEALRAFPPQIGAVVSSFSHDVIYRMHRLDPAVPLGYICHDQRLLSHWRELPVDHAILYHQWVDEAIANEIATAGKKLWVWTVNADSAMLRFASLGVDAIISDDTRLLGKTLGGLQRATSG
jgi:glycerophosphoryl diester phosphodiesterase